MWYAEVCCDGSNARITHASILRCRYISVCHRQEHANVNVHVVAMRTVLSLVSSVPRTLLTLVRIPCRMETNGAT